MAQWYVKKLSKETGVSVKTLYHYESIGLLKPSMRLDNGYRVYTEQDVCKLQHIVALKSFGFGLQQIKHMIKNSIGLSEQLLLQADYLEQKAQLLIQAAKTLRSVLAGLGDGKNVELESLISLIRVYDMVDKLKNGWAGQVMDEAQLKEYAEFSESLKTRFTEKEKTAWEHKWDLLAGQIRQSLAQDPSGAVGIELGGRCMEMVNALYGKKYAKLRNVIWEKGYKKGKMEAEHQWAEPEVIAWLDKATAAYYWDCIVQTLNVVDTPVFKQRWHDLLNEMVFEGETHTDIERKIAKKLQGDLRLTSQAQQWLIARL